MEESQTTFSLSLCPKIVRRIRNRASALTSEREGLDLDSRGESESESSANETKRIFMVGKEWSLHYIHGPDLCRDGSGGLASTGLASSSVAAPADIILTSQGEVIAWTGVPPRFTCRILSLKLRIVNTDPFKRKNNSTLCNSIHNGTK